MQVGGIPIDPQQELFSEIKVVLEENYDVYDGALPPAGTPYPFVYLGDMNFTDDYGYKQHVLGDADFMIHVYHNNVEQRGTLSSMLYDIKGKLRAITATPSYGWQLRNITQRILPDNTTSTPLMHGVLEINYKLTGG